MAKEPTYHPLPDEPCLTEAQLFAYLDERMTNAERHEAERHLLDCPMCSDALEGMALVKDRNVLAAIPPLQKVEEEEKQEKKVIPLFQRRTVWAAAAAIALLIGVSVVLKMNLDGSPEKNLAEVAQSPKQAADLPPTRNDSVQAPINKPDFEIVQVPTDKHSAAEKVSEETQAPRVQSVEDMDGDYAVQSNAAPAEAEAAPMVVAPSAKPVTIDAEKLEDALKEERTNQQKEKKRDNLFNRSEKNEAKAVPTASSKVSTAQEASGASTYDAKDEQPALDSTPAAKGPFPLSASDRDIDLSYTNGVNLLAAGQAQAAIAFFDEVIRHPQHAHYEDALWQKSMALLKMNKKAESKTVLQILVNRGGKYKAQAEAELKKL